MKFITHQIVEYLCDDCEKPLNNHIGFPYVKADGNCNYCHSCALKRGLITAMDWLEGTNHPGEYDYAKYEDGVIIACYKWGKGYRKDEIRIL